MGPPLKLGRSVTRRARRQSGRSLVIGLFVLASTLASCAPEQAARGISLLPDAAAKGETWQWTGMCFPGPSRLGKCAPSGPNLGPAQLNGDEWNLGDSPMSTGSLETSLDRSGELTVLGKLSSTPPCTAATCIAPQANTWVRAYPSVLYGINQCSAWTSPPVSPSLRLPMQVSAIPSDLIGTTAYSSQTPDVTYDIAYDLWLNTSDTRTPCKGDGTVEVLVSTAYDERALLPDSLRVGTASLPYKVNGIVQSGRQAWSIYVSNVYGQGHTEPWGGTVWFVLNQGHTVEKGTVSVDLSQVLSKVGTLLQDDYGWSSFSTSHWLDTIPFGIEFGPESGTLFGAGSSSFSLHLSSYCLSVGTTLAHADCAHLQHR